MKTRAELDIEQFKLRFELEQIVKYFKTFKLGECCLIVIKKNISEINKALGR